MSRFIQRQQRARPLSARELRRRAQPSPRQQQRIIRGLKADAARRIRKDLDERLADQGVDESSV